MQAFGEMVENTFSPLQYEIVFCIFEGKVPLCVKTQGKIQKREEEN